MAKGVGGVRTTSNMCRCSEVAGRSGEVSTPRQTRTNMPCAECGRMPIIRSLPGLNNN
jgi:hypothetical protein